MKNLFALLMLLMLALQSEAQNRINVHVPTAEEEAEHVWQCLQDLEFFEEYGYDLALPDHPFIGTLKDKSRIGNMGDPDYDQLKKIMQEEIYHPDDYQQGAKAIRTHLKTLNQLINEIDTSNFPWGFRLFETYTVNLTLYGPGGSYDPEAGSILLFTTPEGGFKTSDQPINTIIHEITHIGIEASIILSYDVPHALKERIVDTFVSVHFGHSLPDYIIQDMGDYRTDDYLKKVEDFRRLDQIVLTLLK